MKRARFCELLMGLSVFSGSGLVYAGEYFSLQLDDATLQPRGTAKVIQASAESISYSPGPGSESQTQYSTPPRPYLLASPGNNPHYCATQNVPGQIHCATTQNAPGRGAPAPATCAPQYHPHQSCPTCQHYAQPCQAAPQVQAVPQALVAQPQAAPGFFSTSAPRGEVAGESCSIGIRGCAIEFPAIRLALPTLHLPSLVRFRRGPEIRTEAEYAAFTTGAPAVYGQLVPGGQALVQNQVQTYSQVQAQPQVQVVSQPPQVLAQPQVLRAQPQIEAELEITPEVLAELQRALGEKECEKAQPQRETIPQREAAPAIPCATTGSPNDEINELNREYETKLRRIMEAKRAQIEQLERQLEELRMQNSLKLPVPPAPTSDGKSTDGTSQNQPDGQDYFRVSPFGDGN